MGLLFLSTLAYLPLSTAVILDLIAPARRVISTCDGSDPPDPEARLHARHRLGLGIALIACLTLVQCVVFAHAMHELGVTVSSLCPAVLLT